MFRKKRRLTGILLAALLVSQSLLGALPAASADHAAVPRVDVPEASGVQTVPGLDHAAASAAEGRTAQAVPGTASASDLGRSATSAAGSSVSAASYGADAPADALSGNLLNDVIDPTFTTGTNPFKPHEDYSKTGGKTNIIAINGTERAVEFRDTSAGIAGNEGTAFYISLDKKSKFVQRLNEVLSKPKGDTPAQFRLQFKLERTASSSSPVRNETQFFIRTDKGTDLTNKRYARTSIFNTSAYQHDESPGAEVLEAVNEKELPSLRFEVEPSGGEIKYEQIWLYFGVRVDGSASDEAFAVDDLGIYEVANIDMPIEGLIAHWNFDAVSSQDRVIADSAKGNKHPATVVGAVYPANGRINKGLQLKGRDTYLDAGPPTSYEGLNNAFSVSMWVKPDITGVDKGIPVPDPRARLISWIDKGSNGFQMGFEDTLNRFAFHFANSSTKETKTDYFALMAPYGKWIHLTLTWDNVSGGRLVAYANGERIGSTNYKGPLGNPQRNLLIGMGDSEYNTGYNGVIDEVKLYNIALTEDEVVREYNNLPPIPVDTVRLTPSSMNLPVNATQQLTYEIAPYNATDLDVTWSNTNPAVATMDKYGIITGRSPGVTEFTAITKDGKQATARVQVSNVVSAGVRLNKNTMALEENRTEQLQAVLSAADPQMEVSNKTVLWSSDNPAVAGVDTKGFVKGLGPGTAVITAKAQDSGLTDTMTVTVAKTPTTGIVITEAASTIPLGGFKRLSAAVSPANATYKSAITWTSGNPAVAEVDQTGVVIAKGSGQAVITAKADDGGWTAPHTVTVPAVGAGIWNRVFVLRDYLNVYDYPEELISYPLEFPAGTVKKAGLKLITSAGAETAYQLSDVKEDAQGYLQTATLKFRTDLQRKEAIKGFILDYDPSYDYAIRSVQQVFIYNNNDNTATIKANKQQIKVPYGVMNYSGDGEALGAVLAPIVSISRNGVNWIGDGSLQAPNTVKVKSVTGKILEHGLLALKYQVQYTFSGGKTYTVVLTVQHNEQHVTVDETLNGFTPEDETYFKFSYVKGLDPNGRLVQRDGYTPPYSGAYNSNLSAKDNTKLPYEVGLYSINSYGVNHATAFWNDSGESALLFSIYRSRDWKLSKRFINGTEGKQNLNFHIKDTDKYMQTRLEGTERHWALGVIPRSEVVVNSVIDSKTLWMATASLTGYNKALGGAGPEVRLAQKLTDFSLNLNKDRVFDWVENAAAPRFELLGTEADQVLSSNQLRNFNDTAPNKNDGWIATKHFILNRLADQFWDIGTLSSRGHRNLFAQYSNNRTNWTPQERQQARAILAFYAYLAADDTGFPHTSMLAGWPNFVIDEKQTLAVAAGVFPEHPQAKAWRDAFVTFYNDWLDSFVRKADPAANAKGGRWQENPATYSLASLRSVLAAYQGLKGYDGTDILDHPSFRDWMFWNISILENTSGKIRQLPPQGGHAMDKDLPGGEFDNVFDTLQQLLRQSGNPVNRTLGENLLWSISGGSQGLKPNLESALFRDYGAVLRYDFGGEHEAYLNLQQLNGPGYRWSPKTNGVLYYASQGRAWSWNGPEENGDSINNKNLPVLSINNYDIALGEHPVDGVLYNFDFAQYYKAAGINHYTSRSVTMVRDAYISIYDDLSPNAIGRFRWTNAGLNSLGQMPKIYPVKTGSAANGSGDQHHLVAPSALNVIPSPNGAVVGGSQYLFTTGSESVTNVTYGPAVFSGSAGYAEQDGLALFEGTKIGLGDFVIERSGGDFGFSAQKKSASLIIGRLAGKSGGSVKITLPADFQTGNLAVTLNGASVPFTLSGRTVTFDVSLTQSEGYQSYTIQAKS